jgi:RNA polymerase sigma-70 factor (ECF subfamily)
MQREHSWEATAGQQGEVARDADPSDAELLVQVQQRDEHALGLLYDRYGRLIYTIALHITGDRLVAEEVMQDVFYAVWQSAGSFQLERSARAWVIGITRHRAIDATRTRQYRARSRETTFNLMETVQGQGAPDEQILANVSEYPVRQALAGLSEAERQVIAFAYYGGLTRTEIANRLQLPLGTIKSRLRGALMKLHAALESYPE